RGEKIDIIPFNEEPARFVAKALSPARVREVLVDDESKQATVVVPDDQLSLAIGKEGQNARLAARLTGWRVDIRSETEFAQEEAEMGYDEEETAGRCAAILANGKRCPNASLPGSRYCGLPAHQELEGKDTDQVEAPAAEEPAAEEVAPEPEAAEEAPAEVEAEEQAAEEAPAEVATEEAPEGEEQVAAEATDGAEPPERAAEEVVEPVASGEPEADATEEQPPAEEEVEAETPDPESSAAAATEGQAPS